jgi:hypothetical protein
VSREKSKIEKLFTLAILSLVTPFLNNPYNSFFDGTAYLFGLLKLKLTYIFNFFLHYFRDLVRVIIGS